MSNRARKDGLFLLMIGCAAFLLIGTVWFRSAGSMMDFRTAYSSTRCLLDGCDPYNPSDVLRDYRAHAGAQPKSSAPDLFVISHDVYPPSEFAIIVPFAALPIDTAMLVWDALVAVCVILASFLMWQEGAHSAPVAFGWLLCFFLANSSTLLGCGNPASWAVSLCVIGVYCILKQRFDTAGIICLAMSLCLKPWDGGAIWLYFLLAGGALRKRALQTLALVACITLPTMLWVAHNSPHWIGELRANLQAFSHINDPGPGTAGGRGFYMITDLQTVFSYIWDKPLFYNLACFAVCLPLIVLWAKRALRSRGSVTEHWLGVATIAALSMVLFYHRQYDAKLILLAIPACGLAIEQGGKIRRWALIVTATAIVLNGEFVWILLLHIFTKSNVAAVVPAFVSLIVPVPISLLALGSFFLLVNLKRAKTAETELGDRRGRLEPDIANV